ncbi:MAG: discoidin domain-containing protein, partial [Phycisphaerales bacterium]|nr:discoidin domain-containing protein [Phycisphaerales bacterium]
MHRHGFEVTDPIRQFNDYGFTMCSTITGIKNSVWNYMGYPCRYWDIGLHTVPDVWYDGAFHHYDNSLSAYYTLEDGVTVAAVPDIGRLGKGPETGGKEVRGYIGMYKCVNGTGPNGYLEGADTNRDLKHIAEDCFNPRVLKYRYYIYDQDRGHRYSLNLRDGEVYTRYYSRQDVSSPNAVAQNDDGSYKADPAYFVPNQGEDGKGNFDPEVPNPRYYIRGNGERTWVPDFSKASSIHSSSNVKLANNALVPVDASKPAEVVFKVEGANVITSLKIKALATGHASLVISTNNGIQWKPIERDIKDLKLIDEVNGAYEVLVKVVLYPTIDGIATEASLQSIAFNAITQVNSHTQPQLKLGKNQVYVGTGEQTGTISLWPELQNNNYKKFVHEESNITCGDNAGYIGTLHQTEGPAEGYVVFKVEAPQDVTAITYGARMYNRAGKCSIDFSHSFDGGKNWTKSYTYSDTNPPWDKIHYERATDIPAGTKSVLFKYSLNGPGDWQTKKGDKTHCSLFAVHMEVNHKLAAPAAGGGGVEVTFNWQERQKDYSTVKRSHTQLVEKLPTTYELNVGGYDHPIVDSLAVNLKGAKADVKHGYSDGKDVGGEKWVGQWATYGKNLAMGKPYTVSIPSGDNWGAGDPDGKKLTDGRVGSSYAGGTTYAEGLMWTKDQPEIVVDLGETQKCVAFRIHVHGYDWWDAIKGEFKDKVEVLTSLDGKEFVSQGEFDFNLYWKDIPVNYMYTDEMTFKGHNFFLASKAPVQARFVKYKLTPARFMCVTEVQVLDGFSFKPFDLKLAMPDPLQNGKAPPPPGVSPNAKKWKDGESPTTIGKEYRPGN